MENLCVLCCDRASLYNCASVHSERGLKGEREPSERVMRVVERCS